MPIPRLRSVEPAGDAVRQVIRAYHGSPYDFDRFDASKIGTGEGAQAYGHGLYFAGNEGVARSYRDITPSLLPPEAEELHRQVKRLFRQHADLTGELHMAADTDGTFAVGWGNIKDPPEAAKARILPQLALVNQQLADAQNRLHAVLHGRRGHMYEVEIGYPEEALLDWDKPAHTQPDQIYDALGWSANSPLFDTLGRDGWTGRRAYYKMAEELGGADKVSKHLLDSGVPGIRYLDQGSRRAGEGTRNYVMFPGTEDSIRILRKFAVPGAVGVGAASMGGDGDQ